MHSIRILSSLLFLVIAQLSSATLDSPFAALRNISVFANDSFIENIATRADGHLLLTIIGGDSPASIFTFDPSNPEPSPSYYTSLPAPLTGITGITEHSPGQFAVVGGIWNMTTGLGKGFEIWNVDTNVDPPETNKLYAVNDTSITFLNSATTLPFAPHLILIAESELGAVFSFDTRDRQFRKIIQDPSMSANGPSPRMGINGIKYLDGHIYYTNTYAWTFNRLPINEMAEQSGNATVLARFNDTLLDDFASDNCGHWWVTGHPSFLARVGTTEERPLIIENGPKTEFGPTSAAFGRGSPEQERLLYVVNGGGYIQVLDTRNVSSLA